MDDNQSEAVNYENMLLLGLPTSFGTSKKTVSRKRKNKKRKLGNIIKESNQVKLDNLHFISYIYQTEKSNPTIKLFGHLQNNNIKPNKIMKMLKSEVSAKSRYISELQNFVLLKENQKNKIDKQNEKSTEIVQNPKDRETNNDNKNIPLAEDSENRKESNMTNTQTDPNDKANGQNSVNLKNPYGDDVQKYFEKKYFLFSKYDQGIQMDHDSWFSVTPESIAKSIAERMQCNIVVDAFSGVGGNTIPLEEKCDIVLAVENSPERIKMAQHNAKIYGAHGIEFVLGDYYKVVPHLFADCIFMSPPWGGVGYSKLLFDLRSENCDVFKIMGVASKITKNVALMLPKSISHEQVRECAKEQHITKFEIEHSVVKGRHMLSTIYFHDLVNE